MGLSFYQTCYHHSHNSKLYLLAAGTDGQDGPTGKAGCLVESGMFMHESDDKKYKKSFKYIENHDSLNFWQKYYPEWIIDTNGPTGTNVMDIYSMIKIWND